MSNNDQWGVGNVKDPKGFDKAMVGREQATLIFGEHPHSRCDNNIYARFSDGRIEGFDGFRTLVKVEIEEYNYLKTSELSGNEVRKGGTAKIYFDGQCCYEFFHRDAKWALTTANRLIDEIRDKCPDWCKKDSRDKLIGKKIFYREIPAVIERLIVEQGCLIIKPEDGDVFPPPCYDKDREQSDIVKVEVTSPHIWWYRD
jgi:hypothetical protein